MKKIVFRMTAVMALMMMTMSAQAKTQDWGGRVIDEKGEPMPYVNVVLLSLPDSAFVQGAMTDVDGVFKIVTDLNQGLFKVTSVGYQTLYINAGQDLTIQMKEDTQLLSEVVINGQLPKTHVKGDAMRTTVAGTILEKAGTISDALSKIPLLEAERDGGVKVLGRGDAEVYINGRRVQDMKELSRLRSDQIQHVDVVQNPGARYAASVKAVVRITLKKAQGEGLSFQNSTQFMYQYGGSLNDNFTANYRTGGLDVTGSFWVGTYNHYKGLQVNDMLYYVGPNQVTGHSTQEIRHPWHAWSPQLQLNYMVNENHTFGAYYKYDHTPSGETKGDYLTDMFENGILTEHSASYIWQNQSVKKHIFNAYYIGKLGQLGIDLNIDGLFDDTKTPGRTKETSLTPDPSLGGEGSIYSQGGNAMKDVTTPLPTAGGGGAFRTINSNTLSGNNFWASKLIFSYPVLKGNLSLGGEYSYNHRTDAYTFQASDYVPVKATDTEINEKSAAAFVEYGRQFGKVFAQAGLRYEHLTNDYFDFGKRQDEVCRDYGDWFPTATISAPIGKLQLNLSYRRDIQRPAYSNLTSSTIYINRYTYQSGNPYLKPTYNHSLVLNAAYQWANMTVEYGRMKNSVTMSTEPFPGSEDQLVSLVRPINSADDYNQFELSLSARPTIGCWHPMWYAFTVFQNYKTPTANGSINTLNKPYVTLIWNNDIELPYSFRLSANAQWASKGDYNNFSITAQRFNLTLGVQRDFNLRRLGQLTLDVRCADIFNTNKTTALVYGIRELATANPGRRTFLIDLVWKFNEARSKYRGSGAGEKQKARM
ncbi:MAG: TonB-dependent receptor [Prevotella sp.]|nr:TonB-dependent receptor [Prevotella sp.]